MTKQENMVLYYFAHMEILWGLWVISGYYNNLPSILAIAKNFPFEIWTVGVFLIIGGLINIIFPHDNMWRYVLLVCLPLTFLGLLFSQRVLESPALWGTFAVITSKGIFSTVYSAQLFGRIKSVNLEE